jgi:hypothetical protein
MTVLKDFDLFLPYHDKETTRSFGLQTRCITSLYSRLFPRLETTGCWKVQIECVGAITKDSYRNLLGVYAQEVAADPEIFWNLTDDHQKKEWTLDCLRKGIERLLQQTDWPREPFEKTFEAVLAANLVNKWTWGKPALSPSRKLRAEVYIRHDVQSCDIELVVLDRNSQQIASAQLISELPDEWAYSRHLGVLAWESETCIVLRNKARDRAWRMQL